MKKIFALILCLFSANLIFAASDLVFSDNYPADEVQSINCKLSFENLLIEKFYGEEITVEIETSNTWNVPEVSFDDGVLTIASNKRGILFEYCRVRIYLPEEFKQNLKLSSTSGDITLKKIDALETSLLATSGDIVCVESTFDGDFSATATSGDIKINSLSCEDFSALTTSGDIELKNLVTANIKNRSTSGDIKIDTAKSDYFCNSSTSGEIKTAKITCNYFDINSTSGSVILRLTQQPEAESSIKTLSGNVVIRVPKDAAFNLEVSSNSGEFEDDIKGTEIRPRKAYKTKYNGGGAVVSVKTTSGNINLDD